MTAITTAAAPPKPAKQAENDGQAACSTSVTVSGGIEYENDCDDGSSSIGGLGGNAPPTDELPSNPQWQGKIGFDYTIPLQNSLEFFYGFDVFHSDDYFTESRNLVEIEDYTRLNGFLGLGADDRQWQVTLAAKNITDEEDNVSGIFANGFTNIRTPLPPSRSRARARTARTSSTRAETAESSSNAADDASATIRAIVVLPTPGGPWRIIDGARPSSIARRSAFPGPSS